jgi:hypothetical protein
MERKRNRIENENPCIDYIVYYHGSIDLEGKLTNSVKEFFTTYTLNHESVSDECKHLSLSDSQIRLENCRTSMDAQEMADMLQFVIEKVLEPNGLVADGSIDWEGIRLGDIGMIMVDENTISIYDGRIEYKKRV